ncbi:glycosyltransferase family 4 protein [Myroides odoratimimus]|uniref:glycosyltransferase family 4 protein n=1 Tax=Myroides odoratimimus TaxID=76832 RepID=UPI0025784037|nr:glycosyltransferase family 4 protein [Myroides odoratimimus]MDM1521199.1 glycosyltransferase family 4 protein [Myroides odoratimimus]
MILQLTNDFAGSKVYMNLFQNIDSLGFSQIIYTAIREENLVNKNSIDFKSKDSEIIYSNILNSFSDRVFYRKKILKIFKDIEKKIDLSKIKFIHAHTWYSDGGVAYLLHLKYNIPYSIAVRNTDLNLFYKFFLFDRKFAFKILENSRNVFTISEIYNKRLIDILHKNGIIDINKPLTIPNGIDEFWLLNSQEKREYIEQKDDVRKIVYVGRFTKTKNIVNLLKAVIILNKGSQRYHLSIVGGGGSEEGKVLNYLERYQSKNYFSFYGTIKDKIELKGIYTSNYIFVMPSLQETFGLVYIEALSQGLPVLYVENEGIDGFYDNSIGEKVVMGTPVEISEKISVMFSNYDRYKIPFKLIMKNHRWQEIAKKYIEYYFIN